MAPRRGREPIGEEGRARLREWLRIEQGMPWEAEVRRAVAGALGTSPATLPDLEGVTQKHVSQVLSGKSGLSFDFAERALAVLGRRLQVLAVVAKLDEPGGQP